MIHISTQRSEFPALPEEGKKEESRQRKVKQNVFKKDWRTGKTKERVEKKPKMKGKWVTRDGEKERKEQKEKR